MNFPSPQTLVTLLARCAPLLNDGTSEDLRQEIDTTLRGWNSAKGESDVNYMLDLSTVHLDAASQAWLAAGDLGSASASTECGWYIWVTSEEFEEAKNFPPVLASIIKRARDLGCLAVLFDADGSESPAFPTFPLDW